MKPQIGLIAHPQTRREITAVLEQERIFAFEDGFENAQLDAVLYVPGDERVSRQLEIFADQISLSDDALPLLAAMSPGPVNPADIAPFIPVPNLSVFCQLARLRQRDRLTQSEAKLRLETAARLNVRAETRTHNDRRTERILFMGEPSPFYLRCSSDLRDAGKKVEAVLTERTAFEALKHEKPDAFVFTTSATNVPFELLDHIHGRPDLFNLPVIAIAEEPSRLPDLGDRVTALITLGKNDTDNLLQILSVLRRQTQAMPVQERVAIAGLTDSCAGVFNASFAELHLKAQIGQAVANGHDHTVAMIYPMELESGHPVSPTHLPAFGKLVREGLRREDFVARLDWERFLISLPGTETEEAERTMNRIASITELTSQGPGRPQMTFSHSLHPVHDYHQPDAFWRALQARKKRSDGRQAAVA